MIGSLAGLRVLDLTRLLPGGYCTLLFADHGADVIKIEDTGAGDYARADPASFGALNRGKRSVQLDLKSDGGRDALLRLVASADVVIESFRPGVMDRLGVGFDVLRGVNPSLVYCAITGYGQDGPLRLRAGHDLNYLARTGVLGMSGDAGGPPVQAAAQIADIAGGALMAAFGVLAALRSGTGQFVDISMADGALSLLAMPAAGLLAGGAVPRRGELILGGRLLCYRVYECADGYVSMGALEPKFWAAFCRGVGREDLIPSQFDAPGSAAHAEVSAVLLGRTRAEWEAFNATHDCCLEPVLELDEVLEDEHVRSRGMVVDGLLATPVRLSETPADYARGGPPGLGEHTDEVLGEAGYDAGEIAALRSSGAAK
ncbi:CoA transferase [Solirubrobacter ginsenosidimutans]|uniref:CoA transferase n=1 Tax=Solirubrobacter ginsenosidimutans TaxID=490573 RepID=A0A9X3S6L2_9ACTN|nr:CaiB/BaiF CoA-transferase family protein [Solirubrobacter ginsenosidimutans]MDA0162733.1 CoA transferase [Solirubrobacter ginsenosidimutans]